MSMSVKTNTSSINSINQLAIKKKEEEKEAKKLASGFAINSASDDASGLSISEKLKAQIAGYSQASSNSQDGISLAQTADGAMNQINDMLTRMTDLTTQATSSIKSQGVGGQAIQAEINALTSEIDRIASSTNFNGINLLDGSLEAGTVNVDLVDTKNLQITSDIGGTITHTTGTDVSSVAFSDFGDSISINGDTYKLTDDGSGASFEDQAAALSQQMQDAWGDDLAIAADGSISGVTSTDGYVANTSYGSSLGLQVGSSNSSFETMYIDVKSMKSSSLGISDLDVTDPATAGFALDKIKNAINKVSSNRADVGAAQNRLQYNINSLNNTNENITSANSKIRDTDMAKSMMEITKKRAEKQAAQAKLAQANQKPGQVLSLLG